MKKLTFTLLCLVICMCTVVAQNVKVTGTVTAADDGLPIIGASVLVKGTTIGTVTDIEGRFSLDGPQEGLQANLSLRTLPNRYRVPKEHLSLNHI